MSTKDCIENLENVLDELTHADHWLERSFLKCVEINIAQDLTEEHYDDIEALTSRFARVSDLLVQKVFRSIDVVELEATGTLLDAVNRAEKRGIVESAETIRQIREVRNQISHEYITENLTELLEQVIVLTPILRKAIWKTHDYCSIHLPAKAQVKQPG